MEIVFNYLYNSVGHITKCNDPIKKVVCNQMQYLNYSHSQIQTITILVQNGVPLIFNILQMIQSVNFRKKIQGKNTI